MQRVGHIEDDDRLAGLWLRPGTDPIFSAPATMPDGSQALRRVELRHDEVRRRLARRARSQRGGAALEGELGPAAVVSWQALAAVERALAEVGVRLGGAPQGARGPGGD